MQYQPHAPTKESSTATRAGLVLAVFVLFVLHVEGVRAEGTTVQNFTLVPGWNALFLELAPEIDDVEAAFAGIPVESVWAWNPSLSKIDFLQDPSELTLDLPGWLHYVPRPRAESLLNNLYFLQAQQAYLVHLSGSVVQNWQIVGRPVPPRIRWQTDAFTLLGFGVDPAAPPTFGNYLAPSAAHAGQAIFELEPSGHWQAIPQPELTTIRAGEAYWVYTHGASTYQGPLEVVDLATDGLEFGSGLDSETLVIRNNSGLETGIELRRLDSVAVVPLYHRHEDSATSSWRPLPSPLVLESAIGQQLLVDIGVRRAELSAPHVESILEIRNTLGARLLIPISATAASSAFSSFGGSSHGTSPAFPIKSAPMADLSGLWAGTVTVDKVSESQLAGLTPKKTGNDFRFRILFHVDGSGQVRLLKEVIQMWQNGTMVPAAEDPGYFEVGQPGRYVLVTDESKIPQFEGASLRDGVPVGVRMSTAAYDFEGTEVAVTGTFAPGGSLDWVLTLGANAPTNPFLHKFHPDHDNLDEHFLNPREEAFAVSRNMHVGFASNPPESASPGWGTTEISGNFDESVTGLHRNVIYVSGTFELTRVVLTPVLNQ